MKRMQVSPSIMVSQAASRRSRVDILPEVMEELADAVCSEGNIYVFSDGGVPRGPENFKAAGDSACCVV